MTSATPRTTLLSVVYVSLPSTSFQTATLSAELLPEWRHFVDVKLLNVGLSPPALSDSRVRKLYVMYPQTLYCSVLLLLTALIYTVA